MRNEGTGTQNGVGLGSLLIVLAALTASCASSPAAPTDPATVTLAPGASTEFGSLELTFVRVTGDSRCPGDAICISAGDAQALIELDGFGSRKSNEIYLVDPSKKTVTAGDYVVTFDALTPYPFVSLGPIAPANYRATFTLRARYDLPHDLFGCGAASCASHKGLRP
jgi:hypothetical protein